MKLRSVLPLFAAIAVLSLPVTYALCAEDYPARPIKLVVGAPAGSGRQSSRGCGRESPPDGYTLLVSFSSHTINATLYSTLPYDPVADFTPITMVARVTSLLVGRGDLPAKDLRALIDLAKAKPHTLTIGGH